MGTFVRRVRTKSGATAVQIVHKRGRRILSMDHVGSAHDDVQLALLVRMAHERIHALQEQLPLGEDRPGGRPVAGPVVTPTRQGYRGLLVTTPRTEHAGQRPADPQLSPQ